jgi:predicted transcriptional regulator
MEMMRVGILSRDEYQKRTTAIAAGRYQPTDEEPKIWFQSLQSMAQVLSDDNQKLLRLIVEKKPTSLSELEILTQRKKPNLSRTLRTLERYGIVELVKNGNCLIPQVKATDFRVEFGLNVNQSAA